jgi:hypothetical protein
VEDWGLREGLGVYRAQNPPSSPNAPQSGRQMDGATAVSGIEASTTSRRPRRTPSDLACCTGMHLINRGARIRHKNLQLSNEVRDSRDAGDYWDTRPPQGAAGS